jgi:hypothetical protein
MAYELNRRMAEVLPPLEVLTTSKSYLFVDLFMALIGGGLNP